MNKTILIGLWIVILIGVVTAAAPTSPSTLTKNNSIFFNDPFTLLCSGSTDGDGDPIYYEFWNLGTSDGSIYELDNTGASANNDNVANSVGVIINITNPGGIYLSGIETNAGNGATRMRIWDGTTGDLEYTKVYAAPSTTYGATEIYLNGSGQGYYIELDNSGAAYQRYYSNPAPAFPFVSDYVNISLGSAGKVEQSGFTYNIDTLNYTLSSASGTLVQNTTSTTSNNFSDVVTNGTSFNWYCRADDTNGESSAFTEARSIYYMSFYNCSGSGSNTALNFTGYSEETSVELDNVSFQASWTLEGDDSLAHYFDLVGSSSYAFCLSPNDVYVNVTGFVEYDSNDSDYSYPRQYYFYGNEIIGNNMQDIGLYQLSDTYATGVTFTVVRGASTVEGAIIHLQRYNPGTGQYTLVAMGETGESGSDLIYLRLTDAWYRILVYVDGVLEYSGDAEHIISTAYTIYLTGDGVAGSDYYSQWEQFGTITWNINYNDVTNYITLTADDITGASTQMCLKVDKVNVNLSENICYLCNESSSVTLSCLVTNDSMYIAKFIANVNPWGVIGEVWYDFTENISDLLGNDGLFFSLLIIGVLTFVGLWNPTAAIVLSLIGVSFMAMTGLLSLAPAAVIGLIIAGLILIFKMRN